MVSAKPLKSDAIEISSYKELVYYWHNPPWKKKMHLEEPKRMLQMFT